MSYQDGRRIEALEAAVRELRAEIDRLNTVIEAMRQAAYTVSEVEQRVCELLPPKSRERFERLERTVEALQTKLLERPALARRYS